MVCLFALLATGERALLQLGHQLMQVRVCVVVDLIVCLDRTMYIHMFKVPSTLNMEIY